MISTTHLDRAILGLSVAISKRDLLWVNAEIDFLNRAIRDLTSRYLTRIEISVRLQELRKARMNAG